MKTVETSLAAFASVDAYTQRQFIYDRLREYGSATADELENWTGVAGNSLRPRLVELRQAGKIVRTTEQRRTRAGRNAFVYIIA